MRFTPVVLGLLFAAPTAVQAQIAPQASPQVQPGTAPAAEKKICRREDGVGSRLGPRRCLTRSQWAEVNREEAKDRNKIRSEADREERDSSPFGDRPN